MQLLGAPQLTLRRRHELHSKALVHPFATITTKDKNKKNNNKHTHMVAVSM
jgi:hypothetical protein